ncbi:CRISPR-associated helicase/endonuclease Cas3 [Caloramator australicus]|uniref:CRISPR-associated helicase Cas3 n=1 Tax=Caloramator australicus RC3 TaxID=857293 RepID=I7J6X2_9CLOT|nr:CRISPR-associated helicase/endonuclease Cas3 [Caloramator australicus]CCJ34804.1 CRISPR-associated helicase Cas3 [Caloramator australicus RC3]
MIFAKSNPVESLKEHTDLVMGNYKKLKELYENDISNIVEEEKFWDMLEIACFYHDFGKVYSPFQNEIRKVLKMELLNTKFKNDIPHGYLSPAFLNSKYIKTKFGEDNYVILVQAIAFHHERDSDVEDLNIQEVLDKDLSFAIEKLNEEMGISLEKVSKKYINHIKQQVRIKEWDRGYKKYIMIKGLLHRIDHSASAHVDVEIKPEKNISETVVNYINKKLNSNLREPQKFCLENKDNNIIMIASTGIGKTESALLWINNDKAFFTLPLRVSINAIYKRILEDMQYKDIGLLHSTSYDFLFKEEYKDSFEKYEISKQLSYPISLSTIDQLFTFPFKFKGYEKILATLAYSKVVIDEIQAYSPKIAAAILKGIEMIHKMGGKFMIMTATLPNIFKEYLENKGITFQFNEFYSDINRHKICIKQEKINDNLNYIIDKARDKKVLIIVNTVKKAMELYEEVVKKELIKENDIEVNLLNSLFIQKDRFDKEDKIKNFNKNGIWITTQIVEASLDIDFDILFTELSTVDSLFQRMGRCFRKREYNGEEPNIYIYCNEVSGIGTIYDEEIFKKSREELLKYDGKFITEKEKGEIVDKIYSRESLKGTHYLEEFDKALEVLDSVYDYDLDKRDVHKELRDFTNVKVIPKEIYEKNITLIEEYLNERDYKRKRDKLIDIKQLTMDVPYYRVKNNLLDSKINGIFIVNYKYDSKIGLHVGEEVTNFI